MHASTRIFLSWIIAMSLLTPAYAHEEQHATYFIVLAGGSGERLWPLSRKTRPKQLLSLSDDRTLLELSLDRIDLISRGKQENFVMTTSQHEAEIRRLVQHRVQDIIVEPESRNTGPAIAACCADIAQRDPDALIVFLPADAFIPAHDYELFAQTLRTALDTAYTHDVICLVGVQPTFAATGYGYIEYLTDTSDTRRAYKIKKFHEKPNVTVAQQYLTQPTMLWNIGIFAGTAARFVAEFRKHAPELLAAIDAYENSKLAYNQVPSISVDYAIMEKSTRTWVVPASFSWCDVGNVGVFLSLKEQCNQLPTNLISIDSSNNLVDVPDKLIALVGVDDLCIVQTGDVLLITKYEEAEKVRAVVAQLKKESREHYL